MCTRRTSCSSPCLPFGQVALPRRGLAPLAETLIHNRPTGSRCPLVISPPGAHQWLGLLGAEPTSITFIVSSEGGLSLYLGLVFLLKRPARLAQILFPLHATCQRCLGPPRHHHLSKDVAGRLSFARDRRTPATTAMSRTTISIAPTSTSTEKELYNTMRSSMAPTSKLTRLSISPVENPARDHYKLSQEQVSTTILTKRLSSVCPKPHLLQLRCIGR